MNKNMMWGTIVVALIIGVFIGYVVEKQRAISNMEAMKMAMQKQIDDANMMAKTDTGKDAMMHPTDAMMHPTDAMMGKGSSLVMMGKSPKLGDFVTAGNDMTLYVFDKYSANVSNCTGDCMTEWPPYLVTGAVPSTMPAHLGTFTRSDGKTQYTWNQKPLYYFSEDKKVGDTNGDGYSPLWHVAK
jgi:predicted lipoprotein with Yx(FWY)xxD motif